MEIKKVEPNFGMALIADKKAEKFINRLPYDKAINFAVMKMDSKRIGFDVYLTTVPNKWGKERLKATIGNKEFLQSFWSGPVKITRKAVNIAAKLWEEHLAQKTATEGLNIPKIQ